MAAALLCPSARAADPIAASPDAVLLTQAEHAKKVDPARFKSILAQLHQYDERLTAEQRWHLRLLDAWQPSFDGNYGKADPILQDVIDHSNDGSLSVRAMSLLIHEKFLRRQYVDAYALVNALMMELPRATDPMARMAGMSQVIMALNETAVGQYDLALQYARQMKGLFPSGAGKCYADMFETKSLLYAGKLASTSPKFQQAIDACLAAGVPLDADSMLLDQASAMIDQGHADRAIVLLNRIAPKIVETHYPPYLSSLPVTQAQAYLSLGDAAKARKFALASIAITGTNSTMWTLQAAYEVLFKAEKMSGHAAAALAYYEKYVALEKAAMDDAKTRALAYQMVKQEVLAKKMKLDALSKQNSILQLRQALASQAQKTSRLFIALLLVVIAFITLAMFWLRRSQLRFRRMARHDGLTGAFNRDHFFEETARVLRRLHKTKTGVCLVVLDLDHFKLVNDTYGHAAGDEVLRRTVVIVRQELRSSDVFGRLGGEEFGILMPACSRQQGVEVATRIRCALAATSMVLGPQTTIAVSASFGLAFSADSGRMLHQLLIDADTALYCAKDGGRNQVIVSAGAEDPASVQGDARVAISA